MSLQIGTEFNDPPSQHILFMKKINSIRKFQKNIKEINHESYFQISFN